MVGRRRRFVNRAVAGVVVLGAVWTAAIAAAPQRQNLNSPEWKDELSRGFSPYRQLTMEDFPIDDSVNSPYRMVTRGFMHYSYRSHWETSNGFARADVTNFTVRSGFDRNKSWRRSTVPPDAPLLAHEQGHLDINEAHAVKLERLRLPEGSGFTGDEASNDLREKLKALCDRILRESQDEQDKYDLETRHGADRDRQAAWTAQIRKRLKDLKIIK